METLTLLRQLSTPGGTPGELTRNKAHVCYTLERPWENNKRRISSIPAGKYPCKKRISAKYGHHWILEGVPNRDFILIHAGNTINDILGCILVGTRRGTFGGLPAVLESRKAMDLLRATLPDEFILEIIA